MERCHSDRAFYYPLFNKKPKPFVLSTYYLRWITEKNKQCFDNITIDEYIKLFDESVTTLQCCNADHADLRSFANAGGKLIIDHGTDDPLIPVDGTINYYNKIHGFFGTEEKTAKCCRLYITPGV